MVSCLLELSRVGGHGSILTVLFLFFISSSSVVRFDHRIILCECVKVKKCLYKKLRQTGI